MIFDLAISVLKTVHKINVPSCPQMCLNTPKLVMVGANYHDIARLAIASHNICYLIL